MTDQHRLDSSGLDVGRVAGCCEAGHELWDYIKSGEFLD